MGNVYIAINGDDVGTRIGNAIANDDHQDLANASQSIDQAHQKIDEWAEGIGGKKITGSGDEAIYLVPDDALAHMDSIRQDYQESSGHGLTVGVGASMSQASKALIYGKMNGKNQTIHYDPNMEDYLSDEASGDEEQPQDDGQDLDQAPEIPAEGDLEDQVMEDNEAQAGEAAPEEGAEEPTAQPPQAKGQQPAAPKAPAKPGADLANNTNIQDSKAIPKDKAMSKPAPAAPPAADPNAQDDSTAPVGDDSDDAPIGNEDDVSDDNEVAMNSPDSSAPANKSPKQKSGEIDGKTDKDFGAGDGEQQEDEADMQDAPPAGDDLPDGDTDMDSSDDDFAPAEGEFDESQDDSDSDDQELGSDDVAAQGGDEDPLASMIHGDMSEDDGSQDPAAAQDDGADHQELKQDIANALLAFKDNKMMLEQAREQNPDLYNATLTMLRSMISMAKKLGFAPEQDMQQAADTNQMADAMPEADDQGEDAAAQPADDGAEEPAADDSVPEKK